MSAADGSKLLRRRAGGFLIAVHKRRDRP